jgi:hypothetical protein
MSTESSGERIATWALGIAGSSWALGLLVLFANAIEAANEFHYEPPLGMLIFVCAGVTALLNTAAIVCAIAAYIRLTDDDVPWGKGRAIAAIVLGVLGYGGSFALFIYGFPGLGLPV